MGGFILKILALFLVVCLLCYNIVDDAILPSFKSKYDDINLSEDIYDKTVETTDNLIEEVDEIADTQENTISEGLYENVPEFIKGLFSSMEESVDSWETDDADVDGIKEDSTSLLEKLFKLLPYTD